MLGLDLLLALADLSAAHCEPLLSDKILELPLARIKHINNCLSFFLVVGQSLNIGPHSNYIAFGQLLTISHSNNQWLGTINFFCSAPNCITFAGITKINDHLRTPQSSSFRDQQALIKHLFIGKG